MADRVDGHDRPTSLALVPSQQADVAKLIQGAGLNGEEFTWAVQPSRYHLIGPLVSALVHTPTGASFRFEFLETVAGQNRVSVFVARAGAREVTQAASSWDDQLAHVRGWLASVTDEGDPA